MDRPAASWEEGAATTMQLRNRLTSASLAADGRPKTTPANESPAQASTSHDYDDVWMAEDDDESDEEGLDGDEEDNGNEEETDESMGDDTHEHYHYHHHHPHHYPAQIHHQPDPFFYPHEAYSSDPNALSAMDLSDDEESSNLFLEAIGLLSTDMDDAQETYELDFGLFYGGAPNQHPGETHQSISSGPPNAPLLPQASLAPLPVDFDILIASLPDSTQPPPSTITPETPATDMMGPALAEWLETPHPMSESNPNPQTLGIRNPGLTDFLRQWARQTRNTSVLTRGERSRYPWPNRIDDLAAQPAKPVRYADLEGDLCDIQGINWRELGVKRKDVRERRLLTFKNYTYAENSDRWMPNLPDVALPRTESFFRFRRMDIRNNIDLAHFQLRHILAATSRSHVFYPGLDFVYQVNPITGDTKPVMKLSSALGVQVSTMAADHNLLIAGLFNGEYLLRRLDSEEPVGTASSHHGVITTNPSGITNHVQIHTSRTTSSPVAAFSSNDMVFRVLDLATDAVLASHAFPFPLNCSALSPDGRLRVMVGDDKNVLIATAAGAGGTSRPDVLHALGGHRDYGFACDWADDGWTVATGFQDKAVKIWDARRWTDSSGEATPVCTLRAEMASVRGLRFSPVGSGKRVLVAAEEADYVSVIDAQTFRSKQTVDLFGEIGGTAFTNGGHDLAVLCCDQARGGILQLERCGVGEDAVWWEGEEEPVGRGKGLGTTWDWRRTMMTEGRRVRETESRRRRRGADGEVDPF